MAKTSQDAALEHYLREIGKYPLLTREEEHRLALRAAKHKDQAARNQLVLSNLRLVVNIAKEYAGRNVDVLDLIEEGNLGLLHAAEKFDPQKEFRFATYATWWIRRAIRRAVASSARTVRIPTYMVEIVARAKQIQARLQEELKREPTIEEVAEALDLSGPRAALLRSALKAETVSIQDFTDGLAGGGAAGVGVLQARHAPRPDEIVFGQMELQTLHDLLASIDEREAKVLAMRFGLEGDGPQTLRQIGDSLRLSRERVRQIEKRALEKLKVALDRAGFSR